MSRYAIQFYKEGPIRFTSHLDLLRLFKRSLKRIGIKLQHSQGFNPHPKMSFAQPLSLGYTSSSEYLEFDTVEPYSTDVILQKLNEVMPEGIGILQCSELPVSGKSLAALTISASYEIQIPCMQEIDIKSAVESYKNQEFIVVKKFQKKSRTELEINIKPIIEEINGEVFDNFIMLTLRIPAGSQTNLSPELVLSSFCSYLNLPYDRGDVQIKRTGIFFD
ncbi:TIGR03936 family radical SAM-associated protein [Sinanaerobacter chloroacetimidivorans]|uniref:TIGR03936 family radical SAM-associated protein n=1 Tax=Sinanaerobacter chloroacetimidivorans TaxID=2818044 RepID=A0A8J7VXL7_9FIRM|nr:TIGR03936 family radical SAM-associated protein [Sinanaerobacter chloroacetimidivorans]MBR0596571.1 TIGR03936 family radical SAM-associated protein [Sinanaerobacter chloroacetimidivorans]